MGTVKKVDSLGAPRVYTLAEINEAIRRLCINLTDPTVNPVVQDVSLQVIKLVATGNYAALDIVNDGDFVWGLASHLEKDKE